MKSGPNHTPDQKLTTNELIPEGIAARAQVLAVDDLVADEAEDG